jgi:hypothetical protein
MQNNLSKVTDFGGNWYLTQGGFEHKKAPISFEMGALQDLGQATPAKRECRQLF